MTRELRTEILIGARPDRVWEVLTDQGTLGEWNPFIKEIAGDLKAGERIRVILKQPNRKAMTIRPRVVRVNPGEEFRWLGHMGVPGLFDGEHVFELHPDGVDGTRFVQRERFGGLFVPMLWRMLDTDTRQAFEAMNLALKERAEVQA